MSKRLNAVQRVRRAERNRAIRTFLVTLGGCIAGLAFAPIAGYALATMAGVL